MLVVVVGGRRRRRGRCSVSPKLCNRRKVRFDLLLGGANHLAREGYAKKCVDLFTVYVIRGRWEKSVVDGNNRA